MFYYTTENTFQIRKNLVILKLQSSSMGRTEEKFKLMY